MSKVDYGTCPECCIPLKPAFFLDEEYVTKDGHCYKTGRKRQAVDYLYCENCLEQFCVDGSFDGEWR